MGIEDEVHEDCEGTRSYLSPAEMKVGKPEECERKYEQAVRVPFWVRVINYIESCFDVD